MYSLRSNFLLSYLYSLFLFIFAKKAKFNFLSFKFILTEKKCCKMSAEIRQRLLEKQDLSMKEAYEIALTIQEGVAVLVTICRLVPLLKLL